MEEQRQGTRKEPVLLLLELVQVLVVLVLALLVLMHV
jgi:hypothetical protein